MTGALAPMAFTVFAGKPKPSREETIEIVNRLVNMGIVADRRDIPLAQERWSIAPVRGQCHDYAVTKQWLLAAFGIKSQLAEVVAMENEHHLVLVVDGLVLDNLTSLIKKREDVRYVWVRQQSPDRPDFWIEVES
jgi:predicted transglutaminase-like cysteine proteinase